jgi:hypothetical protein
VTDEAEARALVHWIHTAAQGVTTYDVIDFETALDAYAEAVRNAEAERWRAHIAAARQLSEISGSPVGYPAPAESNATSGPHEHS